MLLAIGSSFRVACARCCAQDRALRASVRGAVGALVGVLIGVEEVVVAGGEQVAVGAVLRVVGQP